MAAAKVTSIEQGQERAREAYAEMTGMYQDNADAMLAWSHAMIAGLQEANAELAAFAQARMQNGLELSQRLASCTSPDRFFELQAAYARDSVDAYADEFKKLADLAARVMADATAPLARRSAVMAGKAKEGFAA